MLHLEETYHPKVSILRLSSVRDFKLYFDHLHKNSLSNV